MASYLYRHVQNTLKYIGEALHSRHLSQLSPQPSQAPCLDSSSALLQFYDELLTRLSKRVFDKAGIRSPRSPPPLRHSALLPAFGIHSISTIVALSLELFLPILLIIIFFTSAINLPSRMSWTSRFGSWGGRFSPFGRPDTERSNDYNQTAVPTDPKVTDGDFSYITSADLAAVEESGQMNSDEDSSSRHGQYPYKHKSHHLHHHQQQHKEPHQQHQYSATSVAMSDGSRDDVAASTSFEAPSPNRETDVLVLKHKRITYPVHFPAFSIAHGELRVGEIRAQAAQRLKIHVPRKVKLLSRGRNLRDDNQTARDAGLVAGSVIMCIVGDLAGRGEGIEKHHGIAHPLII